MAQSRLRNACFCRTVKVSSISEIGHEGEYEFFYCAALWDIVNAINFALDLFRELTVLRN